MLPIPDLPVPDSFTHLLDNHLKMIDITMQSIPVFRITKHIC